MQAMGRRIFLFGAISGSPNESRAEPMPDFGNRSPSIQAKAKFGNPLVVIGKISNFPLGEEKLVDRGSLVIESLPEGLRAHCIGDGAEYYAIKSNQIGELIVNRGETWSKDMVYSIMTGEATHLNSSLEEKS